MEIHVPARELQPGDRIPYLGIEVGRTVDSASSGNVYVWDRRNERTRPTMIFKHGESVRIHRTLPPLERKLTIMERQLLGLAEDPAEWVLVRKAS